MASSILNLENTLTETIGWREGADGLEVVWESLSAIPSVCFQIQDKINYASVRCNAIGCQNPVYAA